MTIRFLFPVLLAFYLSSLAFAFMPLSSRTRLLQKTGLRVVRKDSELLTYHKKTAEIKNKLKKERATQLPTYEDSAKSITAEIGEDTSDLVPQWVQGLNKAVVSIFKETLLTQVRDA